MRNTPLEILFHYLEFALFEFQMDGQITWQNSLAEQWTERFHPEGTSASLWNLFPELFGNQEEIEKIVNGEQEIFRLEFVNRMSVQGKEVAYFHLNVLGSEQPGRGWLILEDVTEKAQRLQETRQRHYEFKLSKQSVVFRRHFIEKGILGHSPQIEEVRRTIRRLQHAPGTTVLLQGESGTGKNLVARVIHSSSMPPDAPFVEINCAAIPENLLESELFGHEKGAFTHAHTTRIGLLEEANGGTIFLDEIGELSLAMQAKLLSVLETRKFRRLGGNRIIETNARFIVATNRDLKQAVTDKTFREDLYYRLSVVIIQMPPLRELGEDILLLARHFLTIHSSELKKKIHGFTPAAERAMLHYHWPGNVRELNNCIERAVIFCDREIVDRSELILQANETKEDLSRWHVPPEGIQLEEVEKQLILSALEQAGGNKSRAAKLLGLSRDTLRYRLTKFGLV